MIILLCYIILHCNSKNIQTTSLFSTQNVYNLHLEPFQFCQKQDYFESNHLDQRFLNWIDSLVLGGKFYPNKYLNLCYRIKILIEVRFENLKFIKILLKLRQ